MLDKRLGLRGPQSRLQQSALRHDLRMLYFILYLRAGCS